MLFNSFDFLVFFVIVFALQRALPHRPRNVFLVSASCFFYACWDWRFLSLMFLSTLIDYWTSHAIDRSESTPVRQRLLAISCIANLSILGFFKYANFFIDSADQLLARFGSSAMAWRLDVVLPVGISFYTFQTMSYTIDVYRRQLKPLDSFIDFALYVTLFPQLVAGPIERGASLAPQMTRKPPASWDEISNGMWLVTRGLFKKAVIADNMAPIVDTVFSQTTPTGPEVLLAVYAFAFQIYGDFSGYSDIARGTARMIGYDLMVNFRLPYFALNPSDFWNRWHISLSSWLKDYLYVPLGGNRGGLARTCRNLMLTMVLGGLWHGAAWTFVIWGFYQGAILVLYRLAQFRRYKHGNEDCPLEVGAGLWWCQVVVMFHLTCLGWLIFRAESVTQLIAFLRALVQPWSVPAEFVEQAWPLVLLCLPLVMWQFLEELSKDLRLAERLSFLPRTALYATTMFAILTLGNFGGREFIYFQF